LRACLDWSYDLLPADQQRLLTHLSLFRGGWTLPAAEAVCGEEWENGRVGEWERSSAAPILPLSHSPIPSRPVLDGLERLRECSLILVEEEDDAIRFRMLETVRQYAS